MELTLLTLNAFLNVVKLAPIPLQESLLLPTTAWPNVVSVIIARAVLMDKLLNANVHAKLDNKRLSFFGQALPYRTGGVSTTAKLAKLLALDALELVLLKALLLLE